MLTIPGSHGRSASTCIDAIQRAGPPAHREPASRSRPCHADAVAPSSARKRGAYLVIANVIDNQCAADTGWQHKAQTAIPHLANLL